MIQEVKLSKEIPRNKKQSAKLKQIIARQIFWRINFHENGLEIRHKVFVVEADWCISCLAQYIKCSSSKKSSSCFSIQQILEHCVASALIP
jgi:hypothetical protein